MSGCWQQPNWRTATSCRISSQWHPGSNHCIHFCHQGSQLYISPPPPIQTCANIYTHHPCTNHSVPSITAQMDWVGMVRNTSCPVCDTKEGSFPAVWQGIHQHQLNVSPLSPVTKSESYWMCSMKHVPADSCLLFRNFPLVISMAVCDWWGYGSPLSRSNTCYLEHKTIVVAWK